MALIAALAGTALAGSGGPTANTSGKAAKALKLAKKNKKAIKNIELTPGPAGTNGTNGTNGVSGYQEVSAFAPYDSASPKQTSADCPGNKVIIGGAAVVTSDTVGTPVSVNQSGPTTAGSKTWIGRAYESTPTSENWNLQLTVYCANVG